MNGMLGKPQHEYWKPEVRKNTLAPFISRTYLIVAGNCAVVPNKRDKESVRKGNTVSP